MIPDIASSADKLPTLLSLLIMFTVFWGLIYVALRVTMWQLKFDK